MFALANLIITLARLIDYALEIYFYIIVGRAILSWVNPDPYNPIVRFLYNATEPVLGRIRRFIPYMGGIDISPIIVIFIIKFGQWFIVKTLIEFAYNIKAGGGI